MFQTPAPAETAGMLEYRLDVYLTNLTTKLLAKINVECVQVPHDVGFSLRVSPAKMKNV